MGFKKDQKRYEDELALFSQPRPPSFSPDSDEAYEAFRRHIEEHIQAETRAFHQLRAEAEAKLNQPSPLPSPPSPQPSALEPSRLALEKGKTRPNAGGTAAAKSKRPENASQPEPREGLLRPRKERPWATGLLCLSFAVIGGIGFRAWQQWQPSKSSRATAQESKEKDKGKVPPRATRVPATKSAANPLTAAVSALPLETSLPPPAAASAQAVPAAPPPSSSSSSSSSTPSSAPAACDPSEKLATAGPREKGLITGRGEVRRGPSQEYEILDALPVGSLVEGELTSDRQWLRLEGGRFIALSQLEVFDPNFSESWIDRWVGAKIANVRALPAMQAAVQRKLNLGEKVRVAPLNKQWAKLEGGGFVYTALLSERDPQPMRFPALMRVAAEQATIFSGTAAETAPVGIYFKNHKVQVLEGKEGWYRIGQDQYMRAQDLEQLATIEREGQRL